VKGLRSQPLIPKSLFASDLANTAYKQFTRCTLFHISTSIADFPSIVKTAHGNVPCSRPRFCLTVLHFTCLYCTRTCRKRATDTISSALRFRNCLQSVCFFSLSFPSLATHCGRVSTGTKLLPTLRDWSEQFAWDGFLTFQVPDRVKLLQIRYSDHKHTRLWAFWPAPTSREIVDQLEFRTTHISLTYNFISN
jgi:hypothetical protein